MSGAMTSRSTEPPAGFANSGLATAIPSQFFSRILPQIEAPEELVVSVYFFFAQQLKRRSPRYVKKRELAADATLARSLSHLVAQGPGPKFVAQAPALRVARRPKMRSSAAWTSPSGAAPSSAPAPVRRAGKKNCTS